MPSKDKPASIVERRNFKSEVRTDAGETRHIVGHGSMYDVEYDIGWFTERVAQGAFKRTLAESADVRCLFNHDPNFIVGRTKSGTLKVTEDARGLAYDCTPPTGPMAIHVTDAIERGDVDGSSMGFIVREDSWQEERDSKGMTTKVIRTIMDADLFDVGPVVFPANETADSSVRSLIPAEIRSRMELRASGSCGCQCEECLEGDCADCSNADCADDGCSCSGMRAASSMHWAAMRTRQIGLQ